MPKPSHRSDDTLTGQELAEQQGAPLPDREAMSTVVSGSGVDNFAVPINEALAVNVNTVDSYAIADADQVVILNQVDVDGADGTDDGSDIDDKHPHKDKP